MTVVHITRDFPPRNRGGMSTAVGGLVASLLSAGTDCAVVSFDGWRPTRQGESACATIEDSAIDGVSVCRVFGPDQLPSAHEFLDGLQPRGLHIHDGMLWDFAAQARDRLNTWTVYSAHMLHREMNLLRAVEEQTLSLTGQEAALRGAQRVLIPTQAVHQRAKSHYPDLASKMSVLGFGVDDSFILDAPGRDHAKTPPTVLCVGRLGDMKGTDELIRVVRDVLDSRHDLRFTIVGGLPENARSERRWLKRFETELGPERLERVRWTGWLDSSRLRTEYKRADLYLCTSRFETFGCTVLEAMAAGLPIVGTRCGGVQDLVDSGRSGILHEVGDVDALTQSVVELLGQLSRWSPMSREALSTVRTQYRWSHVTPGYRDCYRSLDSSSSLLSNMNGAQK